MPQPEKTKRKNNHVALKPHAHNSTLCYVENPIETENQNEGGRFGYIFKPPYKNDFISVCVRILAYTLTDYLTWIIAIAAFLYFHYRCHS